MNKIIACKIKLINSNYIHLLKYMVRYIWVSNEIVLGGHMENNLIKLLKESQKSMKKEIQTLADHTNETNSISPLDACTCTGNCLTIPK